MDDLTSKPLTPEDWIFILRVMEGTMLDVPRIRNDVARLWLAEAKASSLNIEPLTEAQIAECITEAGCHGGAMRMSYGSGPYEITRPTINAVEMVRAVERAHGIGAKD